MKFYKKGTARSITAVVVLVGSALFNTNAFAIPVMSGLYSLVGDPSGLAPNQTVADGSFTTTGTVTVGGYVSSTVAYDTVTLSAFTLSDQTGGLLANFTLADFAPTGPIAVLNGSNEVIGFTGVTNTAATATDAMSNITISLLGPDFPTGTVLGSIAGVTFSTNGVMIAGAAVNISGDQVIPEPSAIALLGAGMLAFGFTRRRSPVA